MSIIVVQMSLRKPVPTQSSRKMFESNRSRQVFTRLYPSSISVHIDVCPIRRPCIDFGQQVLMLTTFHQDLQGGGTRLEMRCPPSLTG